MPEETGQEFDPGGEARSVLQGAVSDFGIKVLSNAAIIDGICEDRLPEWPREASLISAAARADVAAMLQQQAGGVGTDTAVRLSAATLAQSRSLDPAACLWVVSEFARALGYEVSPGLRPAGGAEGPLVPAAPPPPSQPGEQPTVLPPAGPAHPPTQMADIHTAGTVTTGRSGPVSPPGQGTVPPAGPPMPGGGPGAPYSGAAPRGPRGRIGLIAAGVALVAFYFVIAGAAHLPPFAKSPAPTPAPSVTGESSTGSSPSPSTSQSPTAADRTLAAYIPSDVSAGGSCAPVHPAHFGAIAEIGCRNTPNIPAGFVNYYMYSSSSGLNTAYSTFRSRFAHTGEDTGQCHRLSGRAAFRAFAPTCETAYALGSAQKGRVVEYKYKGIPDISCTYVPHLLLIDMASRDGGALLKWWAHAPHWVVLSGG